jgi:hypothetical protein
MKAVFTGDWDAIGGHLSAAWDATKTKIDRSTKTTSIEVGGDVKKYGTTAVLEKSKDDAFGNIKAKA